ncbi:zinc-ribbon domain-containing protein [Nocardioides flavescens]|uniref:Zinc-ribbon domain-containing protein n=1 Tax=Nocardioides flavescens TaxID=2691959 RepID=A0A6L7EUF6_9ACTN|nr:zinc-ribbon domain-containing protein [Nocardioides flavescens]
MVNSKPVSGLREARTCGNCGAKNNENSKSCISCGAAL